MLLPFGGQLTSPGDPVVVSPGVVVGVSLGVVFAVETVGIVL